jgi:hypothetical protein
MLDIANGFDEAFRLEGLQAAGDDGLMKAGF